MLLKELNDLNVEFLTEHKLSCVEDNGVKVTDKDGREFFIEAQKVVIAVGNRPDNRLFDQIKSLGIPVHQIGDCLEPRGAKQALFEGAVIGRDI